MAPTLKETIDHLPGGFLLTDTESRVLYASVALERRTGFAVAEIVGKKPGQLWGGNMRRPFYVSLWHTLGADQPFVGEVTNTKKNGAQHDEHIFILPIRNRFGKTVYFAEIHPELSDREGEIAFGRTFLRRTQLMKQDREFFRWIFRALGTKQNDTESVVVPTSWDFQDAASFLEEVLVAPTEKQYARRREDALLITEAQKNPERFSELYGKYNGSVRQYFLRRLHGDGVVAEDLMQEVFARSFRYLPGFRMTNASYYTYLLRVAHNVLVNYYRSERLDTVSFHEHEDMLGVDVAPLDVPEHSLDTLLACLSDTERRMMLYKYRDGLKSKEIGALIGKSENAVKLALSRVRRKLKNSLQ